MSCSLPSGQSVADLLGIDSFEDLKSQSGLDQQQIYGRLAHTVTSMKQKMILQVTDEQKSHQQILLRAQDQVGQHPGHQWKRKQKN